MITCLLVTPELNWTNAQILKGRVIDDCGEALAFTNIYSPILNTGTTTNSNGEYLIKLRQGSNTVVFSYLGYLIDTLKVTLKKDEIKSANIQLKKSNMELTTIFVFASEYTIAERIILTAIANKSSYLEKLKTCEYSSYNKTKLSVMVNDTLKIGGLLETQAKAYYRYPNEFNEIILSKRQTNNFSRANNIFTMGKMPNVLENKMVIDELAVISPLSENALDYYHYNIIDTTYMNNQMVYVIEFSPGDSTIPLLKGVVKIIDGLFVPVSLQIFNNEKIITSTKKNITVTEDFALFENEFWLPVNVRFNYSMQLDIPGIPTIHVDQTSLIFNYEINSDDFKYEFTGNIISEELVRGEESENIWQNNQVIPLTSEEQMAVERIDSITTSGSIFQRGIIWFSKTIFMENNIPVTSLNDLYHFNRVEGHYAGLGIKIKDVFKDTQLNLKTGYGFSDNKWKYEFNISGMFPLEDFTIRFGIYDLLEFFSDNLNYSGEDVTLQSWFKKNDYADYYYIKGFSISIENKLNNYISLSAGYSHQQERGANLNSGWSLFKKENIYNPVMKINKGIFNILSLGLEYDERKYFDYGFARVPDLSDDYFYAFVSLKRGYCLGENNYDFWQFLTKLKSVLNLDSNFKLKCSFAGGMLFNDYVLQRRFLLPGNWGTLSGENLFHTITDNKYSGEKFACLFFESNTNDFFFNLPGIPFLKHNKYDLIFFINYGYIKNEMNSSENINTRISETGFGIDNILALLRINFTWRLSPSLNNNFFFDISTKVEF